MKITKELELFSRISRKSPGRGDWRASVHLRSERTSLDRRGYIVPAILPILLLPTPSLVVVQHVLLRPSHSDNNSRNSDNSTRHTTPAMSNSSRSSTSSVAPNTLIALPSLSCSLSSLPQARSLDGIAIHPTSMSAQRHAESEAKVLA